MIKNEINELTKNVLAISIGGLTKDLINKFSILNGEKYFSSWIYQSYLVFILAKKKFNVALIGLICRNLMEFQILEI